MTEAEWLACWYPGQILEVFADRLSARQMRLFSCACCRRLAHLVNDTRCADALDVLERFADGEAKDSERVKAGKLDPRRAPKVSEMSQGCLMTELRQASAKTMEREARNLRRFGGRGCRVHR